MGATMRWTKRLLRRLARLERPTSSPEEQPAEHPAVAKHAGALCTRCRRTLARNPHQVRAGRARARGALRDEAGRFLSLSM